MPTPHKEHIIGKILSLMISKTKQIKITWEDSIKCFDSLTIYPENIIHYSITN